MTDQPNNDSTYELYTRGMNLLENGDFAVATVPLGKVAAREPEKTSVREALGRALFRSRRFGEAAAEFEAVVDHEGGGARPAGANAGGRGYHHSMYTQTHETPRTCAAAGRAVLRLKRGSSGVRVFRAWAG